MNDLPAHTHVHMVDEIVAAREAATKAKVVYLGEYQYNRLVNEPVSRGHVYNNTVCGFTIVRVKLKDYFAVSI